MPAERIAVLLMAYGSPNRLDDVEPYFTDIRGGRVPSPAAVAELREKYRVVGVPTPLLAVSTRLAGQVQERLNHGAAGQRFTVHLGMKHWTPRIWEAFEEIAAARAERVVALVLAPHYSKISTGGYKERVRRAIDQSGRRVDLDFVDSWHLLEGYIEALAERVSAARDQFAEPDQVTVVFTAHSLPARILNEGDPYQDQLLETSEAVAGRAVVDRWRFSFQSQSQTGEPWLGPDLLDTLNRLNENGQRQVLVAPVGFIADHLEIFYDIDVEAKQRAMELGMDLRRIPMLNDDPLLAEALALMVLGRLQKVPAGPG
jgi:ferrochelatase